MSILPRRLEVAPAPHGIDHVTLHTRDDRSARAFYEQTLAPLGFRILLDWPDGGRVLLGRGEERASLWLVRAGDPRRGTVALAAASAEAVDGFFAAALAAGGQAVAAPGPRPQHTASTYAAEVLDPDGNALEAVCWDAGPHAAANAA